MVLLTLLSTIFYMTFHMKSFYLAFFSLVNLFFAIPTTLVIYTYVFGVTYF
jgi:hypothetical protein